MITDKKSPYRLVTVEELAKLREREDKLFNERTPKSREAFEKAHENLLDGDAVDGGLGNRPSGFPGEGEGPEVLGYRRQ